VNRAPAPLPTLDLNKPIPPGTKDKFKELGPQKFAQWVLDQKQLLITDTTMRDAHQFLGAWMERLGMRVSVDSAGNLHGRYAAAAPGASRLLIGSHLDTVPCAGAFDGVLGVDLIAKLGITIDLKKQSLHVRTVDEERGAELVLQMQHGMHECLGAFNTSDERAFGECFDPKIVLFTLNNELYGREQVVRYFRDKYFHQTPAAKIEMRESAFHPVGDAVWYEYEFTIESARGILRGRGMAMCKMSDGRWRTASMHHAVERLEPVAAREN